MNFKHKNIMKRNMIKAALFAVFAFVAGYGVYTSQKETAMSDLAMANVEALARNESSENCERLCYSWPTTYCVLESSTAYIYCMERYPR